MSTATVIPAINAITRPPGERGAGRGGRVDWRELRDRIDLSALAADLMGPPAGRRGERSEGRLWWLCPLHDDRNPSLCVDPAKGAWRCYGCGASGSAADLVMGVNRVAFGEAVRWLDEWAGGSPPPSRSIRPQAVARKAPERPEARPSGLPEADARVLVAEAADRLWRPEGAEALDYLRGRGLADETIRGAGLGWTPGANIPKRDGGTYRALGVVVPWRDDRGRLMLSRSSQRF
jgi:DNA primase